MTDTRQALAARLQAWQDLAEWANDGWNLPAAATEKLRKLCDDARAALSAQPVAGAVAEPLKGWKLNHVQFVRGSGTAQIGYLDPEDDRFSPIVTVDTGLYYQPDAAVPMAAAILAALEAQAAPAPEPSAQAVAHPSHQTVREWMPVSEALRLSDLWTAGDLDNCGQWRAAIKVLADEVRALAASPQPEPSAQGEPVAFDRMEVRAIVQQAYMALEELQNPGFLIGGVMHYRIGMILPNLNEAIKALASAPSTQPHAVVEAVPLAEAAERIEKIEQAAMIVAGMLPSQDMAHAASRLAKLTSDFRWWWQRVGIAPKAAQEKT